MNALQQHPVPDPNELLGKLIGRYDAGQIESSALVVESPSTLRLFCEFLNSEYELERWVIF
ncbi:MAG: hypothetical protein KDD70_19295, partial [Bdellovibrionales bacterium]|nr:hypothetical protein [Bdellovibrionales bacterium]